MTPTSPTGRPPTEPEYQRSAEKSLPIPAWGTPCLKVDFSGVEARIQAWMLDIPGGDISQDFGRYACLALSYGPQLRRAGEWTTQVVEQMRAECPCCHRGPMNGDSLGLECPICYTRVES